jgi:para-aminobenzoate synthetase/4-amino-4-deoxychorismate lyase
MKLILRDARERCWLHFESPREVLAASRPEEVEAVLQRVDREVARGAWAAGFISYEAAGAFDPALVTRPAGDLPLACFGVFQAPKRCASPGEAPDGGDGPGAWSRELARDGYFSALDLIRAHIAAGDTYQVNFTLRQHAEFRGDAESLFARLSRTAEPRYGGFVDAGRFALISLSPELFFALDNGVVVSVPMKGTAARGLWFDADEEAAARLHASEKNRSENVMIVDMVRNDIGRIARAGSVRVSALFTVERHPTVWQMTSTVTGATREPLPSVLRALFPAASVTGAPKRRAMEIIAGLEQSPRGIYTGTIGFVAPARGAHGIPRAQFNVAIRTITIDRERDRAEYGTGGGIVWESIATDEWLECETKTRVLAVREPSFRLLETLRWDPVGEPGREGGYALFARHLRRLEQSAAFFQFGIDLAAAREALLEFSRTLPPAPHRVRLLVDRTGRLECDARVLAEDDAGRVRLAVAPVPVSSSSVWLYHKTTARELYDAARAAHPGADDVLLWNEHGEITETCTANVCVRLDGEWVTPPVSSGLLPGTCRAQLLCEGRIRERVVALDDLARASAIAVINSVRGWREADLGAFTAVTSPARW